MQLDEYFSFAAETAYLAGRLTLGYFQTGVRPDFKADDTPVTRADREAEQLIRRRIEARYPSHAIVGEEFGGQRVGGDAFRWYIDPIDGTKSFMRGVPLYAVLLGLEIEGRAEVGAAYFPALDEMLVAATGMGCWWNGRRARVSDEERLFRSYVAFTDPASFAQVRKRGRMAAATTGHVLPGGLERRLRVSAGGNRARRGHARPDHERLGLRPLPAHPARGGWLLRRLARAGDDPTDRRALATSRVLLPEVLRVLKG